VPLQEQGGVAGVVTAANGSSFVFAPAIGILLYGIDPHWPFAIGAALLVGLVLWGRRALDRPADL
jgi:MFS family permease